MFYRQAIESDFLNQIEDMEIELGERVCRLAMNGQKYKAIQAMRETTAFSLRDAKIIIDRYTSYKDAYEDFKNNVVIFTDY